MTVSSLTIGSHEKGRIPGVRYSYISFDGTLSTASGLALGLGTPVRVYLGDLAFLHDVGALLIGPHERRPDLQIVVADDRGGSIFATLEHGDPALANLAERVMATPHEAEIAALCAGYGVEHQRVTTESLRPALRRTPQGIQVLQVRVDRSRRRELAAQLGAAVRSALA